MKDPGTTSEELRLNLLLFSVGGVSFGVDAEQVTELSRHTADNNDDLLWFHDMLGFGHKQIVYRAPTVLSILTADTRNVLVVIDNMEDIAEYSVNAIAPLPALLEPFAIRRGIWGVLKRETGLTMLVDFHRIANLPM